MDLAILGNNPLPRPLNSLASRSELVTWLTRILLNTLIPGNGGIGPFRARLPNGLSAFFGLLLHLNDVGYPSHWLGDFVSSVIADNVVTELAPFQGKWPIPLSEINRRVPRRKIRLDPWRLELENILATSLEGIPFLVPLPDDFTTDYTEIALFEGFFQSSSPNIGTILEPFSPFDPVVGVLFYKCVQGTTAEALTKMLPSILDGKKQPAPGDIYVLTSQELVDYPGRRIQWRMSRVRANKMVQDGWAMVAYRADKQWPCKSGCHAFDEVADSVATVTHPVPSSKWRDLGTVEN
jgi:hypothetical protein